MSYLVMECNPAYAVVLDQEGRFIKVANLQYEVGQRVEEVIEMQIPQSAPQKRNMKRWISSIAAVAACFMLIIAGAFYNDQSTYASVYMTINPQVRIDVNRRDKVVGVEGVNEDGKALVSDYDYKKKTLEIVMDELVDLAVEMDFLHEGGKVTLTFDSKSNEWVVKHSDSLKTRLSDHINDRLTVTVEVADLKD